MMAAYKSRARRVLAVPSMGELGGGIGQVSTSLWKLVTDTWPADCDLVTLSADARALPDLQTKMRFGAALARRQLGGRVRWVFFTHLRLARVQQFIPRAFRAPYGVFLHGVEAWDRLAPTDVRIVAQASLRLANSRFTADRAMQANPEIGEVVVCPLALPSGCAIPPAPAAPNGHSKNVLVVGRLSSAERYKGHRELIEAWPAVGDRVPDARLVIAGDGDDRSSLEAKARAVRHGDRIVFTGFLDRSALDAEYARAAIFALPSRGEGFGLVYLEAMANRLPCVGSIYDAATEVIADRVTGLLVDPGDEPCLAGALIQLLTDDRLRHEFGEAGYRRLRERFSLERFTTQVVGLLEQQLG